MVKCFFVYLRMSWPRFVRVCVSLCMSSSVSMGVCVCVCVCVCACACVWLLNDVCGCDLL